LARGGWSILIAQTTHFLVNSRRAPTSGQSIYNWERATATPRSSQLDALAALRRMGKREALARLEQLGAKPIRKS